jgi:hypothetical protein
MRAHGAATGELSQRTNLEMKICSALAAALVLGAIAVPAAAQDAPAKPEAPATPDAPAATPADGTAGDKDKVTDTAAPAPQETAEDAAAREAKLRGEQQG